MRQVINYQAIAITILTIKVDKFIQLSPKTNNFRTINVYY